MKPAPSSPGANQPRTAPSSAEALLTEGQLLHEAGRYADALAALEAAEAAIGSSPADPSLLLRVQIRRVAALRMNRRADEALELARAAAERAARHGDPALHAQTLLSLGYCLLHRGDVEGSRLLGLRASALAEAHGDLPSELGATFLLGGVAMRTNRLQEAERLLSGGAERAAASGQDAWLARLLAGLLENQALMGALTQAAETGARALEVNKRLGQPYPLCLTYQTLAVLHLRLQQPESAEALASLAQALASDLGDAAGVHHALVARGDAARMLGQLDAAEQHYRRALALPGASPRGNETVQLNLALLQGERGRWAEALALAAPLVQRALSGAGAMATAVVLAAHLARQDWAAAATAERLARQTLPTLERAEIEIAQALERGTAAIFQDVDAAPEARALAVRALVLAWPHWAGHERQGDLVRVTGRLRVLAALGAPVPLGPYDLIRRIGSGGVGEVWEARHHDDGHSVAIKLLTARSARRSTTTATLRAEVRAVARLNHATIVRIDDQGLVDAASAAMTGGRLAEGCPYLVMELCTGNLIGRCGQASWQEIRHTLAALLGALAHAHARDIVHLDIKPDNVLLSADGQPRLTDFGLARVVGEADARVLGTPAYMAPEQIRGDWRAIGPWTDLYALGCLAWTLLTGDPPYGAEPAAAVMERKLQQDPGELQTARPLPAPLRAWLERLLCRAPEGRFQLAADALRALESLGADPETAPGPLLISPLLTSPLQSAATFIFDEPPSVDGPQPRLRGPVWVQARADVPSAWLDPAELTPRATGGLTTFGLREVPVCGRQEERQVLWEALRAQGRRAVVVIGAAGLGKTRLLRWLAHRAHETGAARILWMHGGDPAPALRALLRVDGLSGPALAEALAMDLDDDDAPLAALLEPERARALSPEQRVAALARLLARIALEREIILILDDAHTNAAGLDLLAGVLEDPSAPPLLAVVAARDDLLTLDPAATAAFDRVARTPGARPLPLAPLPEAALEVLLRARVRLEPTLATQLAARAQGNPLYALEMVGDWVARDLLVPGTHGHALRPEATIELPASMRDVWTRRLATLIAGLPPGADQLLELLAIWGGPLPEPDWRALAQSQELPFQDALLERLLDAHLARRDRGVWRLTQGMLGETLIAAAAAAGRSARAHGACADLIALRGGDALDRAHHLFGADVVDLGLDLLCSPDLPPQPERALAVADVAVPALHRAALPPDDPRWLRLWRARASALRQLGREDEAARVLARALGARRG